MKVYSINDRIRFGQIDLKKDGFYCRNARPEQGFFVVDFFQYTSFYNQEGREVFRVASESQSLFRRIWNAIRVRP